VGHGAARRVESRIPGADVNPYIVLAGLIAAGLYGIDHELDCGDPFPVNAYDATDVPRIPSTLVEAIDALRGSTVAVEAFGEEVHHHLLNTAVQEWEAANRHVTDWELARNFERI
jgi:glutamine synthetase